MHVVLVPCLAIWLLAVFAGASGPTKIYIDSVPEYDLLQSCAEHQVSVIVRGMEAGCGDGSKLTSYACFCFQSSAYYSRMISTRVASDCSNTKGQENSAVEVFSKYCQLADLEKVTTTDSDSSASTSSGSSPQSTSASPASTAATTTVSSTTSSSTSSTATSTRDPSSQTVEPVEKKDNTAAIAAGVTVPVVVIALGLIGFLLYLHRRRKPTQPQGELPATSENQATEVSGAPVAYEKESYRHAELDAVHRQELDASTSELTRDRKIPHLLMNDHA